MSSLQSLKRQNAKTPNSQNDVLEDDLKKKIIDYLKKSPETTQVTMTKDLGIPYRTLQRQMDEMKTNGIIERVGGKRYGHWKVHED